MTALRHVIIPQSRPAEEGWIYCTSLMISSMNAHCQVVNLLLKAGANPDQQARFEWTALMLPRQNDQSKVVNLLLKAGANPEQQEERLILWLDYTQKNKQ